MFSFFGYYFVYNSINDLKGNIISNSNNFFLVIATLFATREIINKIRHKYVLGTSRGNKTKESVIKIFSAFHVGKIMVRCIKIGA